MLCQNCGTRIVNHYVRSGKNGTVYCSTPCSYEPYEGYYTKEQVDKTMTFHKLDVVDYGR